MSLVNPSYIPSVSPVPPLYNGDRWGLGGDWGLGTGWTRAPVNPLYIPSISLVNPIYIPAVSPVRPLEGGDWLGTGWGLGIGTQPPVPTQSSPGWGLGVDWVWTGWGLGTGCGLVWTPRGDRKMAFEVQNTNHSEVWTGGDQLYPVWPYIIYIGGGTGWQSPPARLVVPARGGAALSSIVPGARAPNGAVPVGPRRRA